MMNNIWDDYIGIMNAVFGEATAIEAINWIKPTANNALEYHNDCFFDDIDRTIDRIMYKETGTRNWDNNDVISLCKKWSGTIIKMGFTGIRNPQLVFLVSDLVYWPEAFEIGINKHGEDVVVDILNTLIASKEEAVEDLTEILLADDPYDKACKLSGIGYEFLTEKLWLAEHDRQS